MKFVQVTAVKDKDWSAGKPVSWTITYPWINIAMVFSIDSHKRWEGTGGETLTVINCSQGGALYVKETVDQLVRRLR